MLSVEILLQRARDAAHNVHVALQDQEDEDEDNDHNRDDSIDSEDENENDVLESGGNDDGSNDVILAVIVDENETTNTATTRSVNTTFEFSNQFPFPLEV